MTEQFYTYPVAELGQTYRTEPFLGGFSQKQDPQGRPILLRNFGFMIEIHSLGAALGLFIGGVAALTVPSPGPILGLLSILASFGCGWLFLKTIDVQRIELDHLQRIVTFRDGRLPWPRVLQIPFRDLRICQGVKYHDGFHGLLKFSFLRSTRDDSWIMLSGQYGDGPSLFEDLGPIFGVGEPPPAEAFGLKRTDAADDLEPARVISPEEATKSVLQIFLPIVFVVGLAIAAGIFGLKPDIAFLLGGLGALGTLAFGLVRLFRSQARELCPACQRGNVCYVKADRGKRLVCPTCHSPWIAGEGKAMAP